MKIKIVDYATSEIVTSVNFNDIKEWNEEYRSHYPQHLLETLRASILNSGIQKPITVIEKESTFFCVDGLRRLQIAQELELEGKWTHGDISVNLVSTENIEELYAACAFQKKGLKPSQRAFFAAKWYYEDIKKLADENKRLSDEGKEVLKKINTSLTVAQLVGIKSPDHIAKAYQLLKHDEWFYECVYKLGFNFPSSDVKQLLGFFKDENTKNIGYVIIDKMKALVKAGESQEENKNLYKTAYDLVKATGTNVESQNTSSNEVTPVTKNAVDSIDDEIPSIEALIAKNNSEVEKMREVVICFEDDSIAKDFQKLSDALKKFKIHAVAQKIENLENLKNANENDKEEI